MVLLNERIKDRGKILVGVPVTSIDTTVLVVKLHSAGNGFGKGESRSLGLDLTQLVPLVPGDMLGHKGVGGPDHGEAAHANLASRAHAAGLGLEGGDDLEGVVDHLVGGQAAGDHVPGGAAVINDNKSLPGNALLLVIDSVLLANLSRSVSKKGNLTFSLKTTVGPREANSTIRMSAIKYRTKKQICLQVCLNEYFASWGFGNLGQGKRNASWTVDNSSPRGHTSYSQEQDRPCQKDLTILSSINYGGRGGDLTNTQEPNLIFN